MNTETKHIDEETIEAVGLRLTETPLTAEPFSSGLVYEYPHLENVYVMENDLYGNPMPADSCFLAFNGTHGLIGKPIKLEKLRRSTVSEIEQIVENNKQG